MSAERVVKDGRALLATIAGAGAVSAGKETLGAAGALASRARALGMANLSAACARLAKELEARGSLAYEASLPLMDAVLEVHDRIEALASLLELWAVEESFAMRGDGA